MDSEILFSEKQKFSQWWLRLILIAVNGLILFGIFKQVIGGQQFGDKPMSNLGLLLTEALILILTILCINFQLETRITKDGVYVRFFPFHFSFKYYGWNKISKSFTRQYNPITEYGGWGLRLEILGSGKAFNVSGDKGLQLEFIDKKKLLIGTHKVEELTETLNKIGQFKK